MTLQSALRETLRPFGMFGPFGKFGRIDNVTNYWGQDMTHITENQGIPYAQTARTTETGP